MANPHPFAILKQKKPDSGIPHVSLAQRDLVLLFGMHFVPFVLAPGVLHRLTSTAEDAFSSLGHLALPSTPSRFLQLALAMPIANWIMISQFPYPALTRTRLSLTLDPVASA